MHALAPLAHMKTVKDADRILAMLSEKVKPIAKTLGILELFPGAIFITPMV